MTVLNTQATPGKEGVFSAKELAAVSHLHVTALSAGATPGRTSSFAAKQISTGKGEDQITSLAAYGVPGGLREFFTKRAPGVIHTPAFNWYVSVGAGGGEKRPQYRPIQFHQHSPKRLAGKPVELGKKHDDDEIVEIIQMIATTGILDA